MKRPGLLLATPGRLELPAPSLGNLCSILLSYGVIWNHEYRASPGRKSPPEGGYGTFSERGEQNDEEDGEKRQGGRRHQNFSGLNIAYRRYANRPRASTPLTM